jgi:hypothetical protein
MRPKNRVRTKRLELSVSENARRVLDEVADLGILGKTGTEVATGIVNNWIWDNEGRLSREGIRLGRRTKGRSGTKKLRSV